MKKNSFTLIEVLVGGFLILIIFLGIFGAYQLGIRVVSQNKSKVAATAIANGELEMLRNLSYGAVGVDGGFPSGDLPATKTKTVNNSEYTVKTRIDHIVDPVDGIASPEDECPHDYKRAEITVSWGGLFSGEIKMTVDIAPKTLAQECAEEGGILYISVFDAFGVMIDSPLIEVKDVDTGETLKSATPTTGEHFFSLPDETYRVIVSKGGHNTERSYGIEEIADPEKPDPLVIEDSLTEVSFSIDKISSFSVDTCSSWSTDYFLDSFNDQSKISEFLNVEFNAGDVALLETGGFYETSGYLISEAIVPTGLSEWDELSWNDFEPENTHIIYQVLYFSEVSWILIPEDDLTGNSAGFESSPIGLSSLDIVDYPQIKIKATLSTTNTSITPLLYDWQVSWKSTTAVPIANVDFHLKGNKLLGRDGEENPIYKYSEDHVSSAGGHSDINNLTWDLYTFSVDPATGLDLDAIDPSPQPISLDPDTVLSVVLYLSAQNSFLATVLDDETGAPLFSADVRLHSAGLGYDDTQYTNEKGQAYFIPLESGTYNLEINSAGYSAFSAPISVSGDKDTLVEMERLE